MSVERRADRVMLWFIHYSMVMSLFSMVINCCVLVCLMTHSLNVTSPTSNPFQLIIILLQLVHKVHLLYQTVWKISVCITHNGAKQPVCVEAAVCLSVCLSHYAAKISHTASRMPRPRGGGRSRSERSARWLLLNWALKWPRSVSWIIQWQ